MRPRKKINLKATFMAHSMGKLLRSSSDEDEVFENELLVEVVLGGADQLLLGFSRRRS